MNLLTTFNKRKLIVCSILHKFFIELGVFLALGSAILVPACTYANPLGGHVVGGAATILNPTPNVTQIRQTSQKAIINWKSYNIGRNQRVNYLQPNSSSITLNRINPQNGASLIYGMITANGQVWLVNPAGIWFGPTAYVNVSGLLATTANITNQKFMLGDYRFVQNPNWNGAVINNGTIIINNAGLAALVGTGVVNNGFIQATLGTVVLASGMEYTVDFSGNSLVQFAIGRPVSNFAVDQNGNKLSAAVTNSGVVAANGGRIMMSAQGASGILDHSINMSGYAVAKSVGMHNGEIVLNANEGTVDVTGTIVASGKKSGETGGTVEVLGSNVNIHGNASINVSGDKGGGNIFIGGDAHGEGPLPDANYTYVGSNVKIIANAVTNGNGGNVVVRSNLGTQVYGNIFARGGLLSGNGGYVETSGRYLNVNGATINTLAPAGMTGTWLLDPTNIWIASTLLNAQNAGMTGSDQTANTGAGTNPETFQASGAVPDSFLSTGKLDTALRSNNVLVTTSNASGTGSGNITVVDAISWASAKSLTLTADNNIFINAAITTGTAASSLILNAAGAVTQTAAIRGSGKLVQEGTGTVTLSQANTYTGSTTINSGIVSLTNAKGLGTSGANSITVNSGAALDLDFSNATLNTSKALILNGVGSGSGALTFSGANITMRNATTLASDTTIGGTGTGTMTMKGTINGGYALTTTLNNAGIDFSGRIGGTTPLSSINVTANSINAVGVTTTGEQNYTTTSTTTTLSGSYLTSGNTFSVNGPVLLGGNTTVDTANGGITTGANISFKNTIDNTDTLSLSAGTNGSITLSGAAGSSTPLKSFTANANTISLENVTTAGGKFDVTGATLLGNSAVTVDTTNGGAKASGANISFNGTINNADALTLLGGTGGTITLGDSVGGNTPLSNLTVTSKIISAQNVSTTDEQNYTGSTRTTLNGTYLTDANTFSVNGPLTLGASGVSIDTTDNGNASYLAGADVSIGAVTSGGNALSVNSGTSGAITGSTFSGGGDLTITNSANTTFSGAVNAGIVTLSNTLGNIIFNGSLTAATLSTAAQSYHVEINSGATITNAATFSNTGGVTLARTTLFKDGVISTASTNTINGTVKSDSAAIDLGAITLGGASSILTNNTGTGADLTIGAVTSGGNALSLNAGSTGTMTGWSFSDGGDLKLTNSNNATFNGDINAGTVALNNSTGNIIFNGALNAASLTTAGRGYGVQINDGGTITNAVTFSNRGTLVLGDAAASNLAFTGGVRATAPSIISVAGTISAAGTGEINLNKPISVTDNATIGGTSTGLITLGATTIADNMTLNVGAGANTPITLGTVNGDVTPGTANLNLSSGTGKITLGGAIGAVEALNQFTATSTGATNDIVIAKDINTTGNLSVTAGRTVTLSSGNLNGSTGNVSLTGTAGLVHETGAGTISGNLLTTNSALGTTLDKANSISSFNATNTNSGDISLTNSGALSINGVSQSAGNLTISNTGKITQAGAMSVSGTSSFSAGSNPITLGSLTNALTGAVTLSNTGSNDVSLFNNAALQLAASTIGRNLTVTATGPITQTGKLTGSTLTAKTLNDTGSSITLTNGSNDFATINISARNAVDSANAPGAIFFNNLHSLNVAGIQTASTINLTSGEAITDSGAMTGTTLTTSSVGGTVLSFGDALTGFNANNTSGGNISLINTASPLTITGISQSGGGITSISNTGGVTVKGTISGGAGAVSLIGTGALTLNNGSVITTNASGNAIVLAGSSFTNNAGASVLNPGSGRFLVWSGSPSNDTHDGLTPNFIQYNATYGVSSILGSGNGFLYSLAPVITTTLVGTISKTYDQNANATLTSANYSSSGVVGGDTVTLNYPTSGLYDNPNAGTGKNVSVSGISITSATNGAATVYGYTLGSAATANGNIGTINPVSASIAGVVANNKTFDNTSIATLNLSNAILSGILSGDVVVVNQNGYKAFFTSSNIGNNIPVIVSYIALNGSAAGNYSLQLPIGLVANILPDGFTNSISGGIIFPTNYLTNVRVATSITGTVFGGSRNHYVVGDCFYVTPDIEICTSR